MPTKRKNILLVSFDDATAFWPYKTAFGEALQTPNLDRICEHATAFTSAYCQAPICGPSRSSFMSGRTPHQLGIFDNYTDVFDTVETRSMWPYRLKENGFFCSSGGKVHHRYKPVRRVFHNILYSDAQKRFGSDMNLPPDLEKQNFGGNRGGWSTTNEKDDDIYYDHKSAESAISFLDDYDDDAPFYREVGFYSPHGPHYTPVRFKQMYNPRRITRPDVWDGGFDYNEFTTSRLPENEHIKSGNLRWWRNSVRNYFSAYSHGDYHLGRVWDALQASRHADNTVVVIVSDHGFHLGNRNRYMKTTLWEQVASVPMIIYDPDRREGRQVDDPVALLDVGPTVLDYAELPPLDDCVGRSLRPQVEGASDPDRAVATVYHNNVAIRKGDYRIIWYEDGSTQLFDLTDDFWQLNNLGEDHPAFDTMYAALAETGVEYGFTVPAR